MQKLYASQALPEKSTRERDSGDRKVCCVERKQEQCGQCVSVRETSSATYTNKKRHTEKHCNKQKELHGLFWGTVGIPRTTPKKGTELSKP